MRATALIRRAGHGGSIQSAATTQSSMIPPKVSSGGVTNSNTVMPPMIASVQMSSPTTPAVPRTSRARLKRAVSGAGCGRSGTSDLQPVADASDRDDADARPGTRELGAQPAHVHVDQPGVRRGLEAPAAIDDLLVRDDPTGMLDEQRQQVELLAGEAHPRA